MDPRSLLNRSRRACEFLPSGGPPLPVATAAVAGFTWGRRPASADRTGGCRGRQPAGPLCWAFCRADGPNHLDLTGLAPIYVPPTLRHRRLAPAVWLGLPDNQPFSGGSRAV